MQVKKFLQLIGILPVNIKLERMVCLEQYQEVRMLRMATYGKRYPTQVFPEIPDFADSSPSTVIVMARCSETERLLGTIRFRHSGAGLGTAGLSEEVFPKYVTEQGIFMTIDRFAIHAPPRQRLWVRLILFSCVARLGKKLKIPWLNCVSRDDMARVYKEVGFSSTVPTHRFTHPAYFNVEHELYQTETQKVCRKATLKLIRFFIWRFRRPLPLDVFAPENMGGPSLNLKVLEATEPVVTSLH
jgi:hypothetical protein